MANPNPAHNPTDGLGSAVYVQLAGTGVTPLKTVATGKPNPGPYTLSLSLTSANGLSNACTVTPSLVDANNTAYSATAANWVFNSYNNPNITETCFSSLAPKISYTAKVASVGANGASTVAVTALAVGQAIIEVSYPTFDNTEGNTTGKLIVPKDAIYAQIIVTVNP